jgi:hypothetical protein
VRAWALAFGVPLLLTTAVCVLTLSITMAAPWRTIGIWALLLPFEALAILRLADRLGRSGARRRGLALAVLLAVALLPPAARSAVYVREGMLDSQTGAWREDRAAGLHVVRELGRSDAKALLDSAGKLEFLDVLGGSGAPERLVLSHGTDPQVVANKAPFHGPAPPDRFDLARGGSDVALAAENIRLLLLSGHLDQPGSKASALRGGPSRAPRRVGPPTVAVPRRSMLPASGGPKRAVR